MYETKDNAFTASIVERIRCIGQYFSPSDMHILSTVLSRCSHIDQLSLVSTFIIYYYPYRTVLPIQANFQIILSREVPYKLVTLNFVSFELASFYCTLRLLTFGIYKHNQSKVTMENYKP